MESLPVQASAAICYHVEPGSYDGWDVIVERQQHVVTSTHCSDWHRVERICAALERQQQEELTVAATRLRCVV